MNILESTRYASGITLQPDDATATGETGAQGAGSDLASRLRIRGFKISTVYRNFNPTQYSPWGPLIDRIEVVKGPASALYGRAAPGGTVNFLVKRPKMLKKTSISLTAGLENINLFRGVLDHENVVLDDKLGYRIVAAYQNTDGVKDFTPDDHATVLANLKWEPTKKDTVLFEVEYAKDEGHGAASVHTKDKNLGSPSTIPRTHPEDRFFNPRLRTDFAKTTSAKVFTEYRRELFEQWDLQLNFQHSDRELETDFTQFDFIRTGSENYWIGERWNPEGADGNDENLNLGYQRRSDERIEDALNATVVGQFGFLGTENSLLVGGTYFTASADILTLTPSKRETRQIRIGCPPNCPAGNVSIVVTTPLLVPMKVEDIFTFDFPALVANATDEGGLFDASRPPMEIGPDGLIDYLWRLGQKSVTDFTNKAFFAMNTTKLWKAPDFHRLRFMYGVRYDDISQENTFTRISRNIETFEEELIPVTTEDSGSKWTYQGSAMFNLWRDLGIYYSRSTSFVQQFSSVREKSVDPSRSTPAGPLLGDGDEVGIKFGLFNGKIAGTLAAYRAEEQNRVQDVGEDKFGLYQQTVKFQNSEGFDADLIFTPIPEWQTLVVVTYVDTTVINLDPNDPLGDNEARPPNMNTWQARAFSSYRFSEGMFKGVMLGLGVDWMDNDRTIEEPGGFGHPGGKDRAHLESYLAFDLVLGYEWRWGNYDYGLQLNLKNLTDERYFTGGNSYANPRTSQLTLKVSF